jgi:sec-independent protein translocase protein TatC
MGVDEKPTFRSRLIVVRNSFFRCAGAIAVGVAIASFFADDILRLIALPLKNALGPNGSMIYKGLTEMIWIYIKIAFIFGVILAVPYIFYEIWRFLPEGPKKAGAKSVLPVIIISAFLFMGGAVFGYIFAIPLAFKFLLSFANEQIQAVPSVEEYLSFCLKFFIAFGIIFEVPLIVFFLSRIGLVSVEKFRKNRKYAILMAFVIGAFFSADVVSQCMMAIPIILLYEVGIIVAWISGTRREKVKSEESEV